MTVLQAAPAGERSRSATEGEMRMAFMICKRHGGHICAMVCSHLADGVNGLTPEATVRDVGFVVVDFHGEPGWRVDLCPQCAASHGLGIGLNRLDDDEIEGGPLDRLYSLQHPVCSVCYREWMERAGIACPLG
jgi:hypothetical protein